MSEQGEAAALLRPDSEKNRQFYRKNGFADCSTVGVGQFTAGGGETLTCAPAEPEQYDAIRRKMAPWGLHWGKEGLATQKGWMKLYGGDLWLLGTPEQPRGCAAVSREGETPLVRELLCPEALRAQALEGLCKVLECRELHLRCRRGAGGRPADRADDDAAPDRSGGIAGDALHAAGNGLTERQAAERITEKQ